MTRLVNVARLLVVIVLANFLSGTFLVICGFKGWDIAAATMSLILSLCLIHIEVTQKLIIFGRDYFSNTLVFYVLIAGASAFFWFFHIIYKVGHYQGDFTDLLWSTPTRLIAFLVSLQLVLMAHRLYRTLTDDLLQYDFADGSISPLSTTTLVFDLASVENINNNNNSNKPDNVNPA